MSPINTFGETAASTPPDVDTMISRAVSFIYTQEQNGNWEKVQTPDPTLVENKVAGLQWTGLTALTAYALLQSGQSKDDPRLVSAIHFLQGTRTVGTYALGARCLLWSALPLKDEIRQVAQRDAKLLLANVHTTGSTRGLLWYGPPAGAASPYDTSTSQFGALGLSALQRAGLDVPVQFWSLTAAGFTSKQRSDGGWSYSDAEIPGPAINMTGAAVASLLVSQEFLHTADSNTEINHGIDFLAKHFEEFPNRFPDYALFGFSRIGGASGLKYFGPIDWYQRGVDYLARTQKPDGRWAFSDEIPSPAATAFSLLFLDYGSAPIVINKLRYNVADNARFSNDGWNAHPLDAANLARRIGHDVEQRLNWQVTSLDADGARGLHDAPILWIIGDKPLNFSSKDKETLQSFVEEGGLILGNALGRSEPFRKSFIKLAEELFPAYEFRQLSRSHPIFNYPSDRKTSAGNDLAGISNGVRELLLLPSQDLSRSFEQESPDRDADALALGEHIVEYASDLLQLSRKGIAALPARSENVPDTGTATVLRLKYAGNWNPEPAGWNRLAVLMHNANGIDVLSTTATLGDASFDNTLKSAGTPFTAHLTGTSKISLNAAQQHDLMRIIDQGGTLVIDSAGGSSEFAQSVETILGTMFKADAETGLSAPLPMNDGLFTQRGNVIDRVTFRTFARGRIGGSLKTPRIFGIRHGGRTVVYYSPLDLSGGLVGEPVDGICGYSPQSATALMRNLVLTTATNSKAANSSREVGSWTPAEVSDTFKILEWHLTADQLHQVIGIQFKYQKGAQRLDVEWASIVVDGKEISRDGHVGYAGMPDYENNYRFNIPDDLKTGNHAGIIRASVKCPIGNDSTGRVQIMSTHE